MEKAFGRKRDAALDAELARERSCRLAIHAPARTRQDETGNLPHRRGDPLQHRVRPFPVKVEPRRNEREHLSIGAEELGAQVGLVARAVTLGIHDERHELGAFAEPEALAEGKEARVGTEDPVRPREPPAHQACLGHGVRRGREGTLCGLRQLAAPSRGRVGERQDRDIAAPRLREERHAGEGCEIDPSP